MLSAQEQPVTIILAFLALATVDLTNASPGVDRSILEELNGDIDPLEFSNSGNDKNSRYVSFELHPNIDYYAGLYDPTYHIQHQRQATQRSFKAGTPAAEGKGRSKKRNSAQRAGVIKIHALQPRLCGGYRSKTFDKLRNAYDCSDNGEGDLRSGGQRGKSEGEKGSSGERNVKGKRRSGKGIGNKKVGHKIKKTLGTNSTMSRLQGRGPVVGSQRMSGGYQVRAGEYPSFVILDMMRDGGKKTVCSGAVIHSSLVITAAHCFKNMFRIDLRFGMINLNLGEVPGVTQMRKGRQFCVSKDFVKPGQKYKEDVALIEFGPPLLYTDYVKPICLSSLNIKNTRREPCMAVGVGETRRTNKTDYDSPKIVKADVMGYTTCRSSLNELCVRHAPGYGLPVGHNCGGDSGSPLICKRECPGEDKPRQVLQGVMYGSDGYTCLPDGSVTNYYTEMYKDQFVIENMLMQCGFKKSDPPVVWWNPVTWG